MTETLATLLWRLSEGGVPAIFPGCLAKDHFGPEFDGLLNRRIVVELARVTEWSICDACECGLSERPIQTIGDRLIATCPLDSARDAALEPDDTRQFEINIARLVAETANQSGFNSPELVRTMFGFWAQRRMEQSSPPRRQPPGTSPDWFSVSRRGHMDR